MTALHITGIANVPDIMAELNGSDSE